MSNWSKENRDALAAPFDPEVVEWKPQQLAQDKTRCMAVAYVDMRHYMARLDEVFPGLWGSFSSLHLLPPSDGWEGLVVVRMELSVAGVTRTGEGECKLKGEENSVTSATAQAFKRACVAFGLGAYLYTLPRAWVDYDSQRKRITPEGLHKLRQSMYNWNSKHQSDGEPEPEPSQPEPDTAPAPAAKPQSRKKKQPEKPAATPNGTEYDRVPTSPGACHHAVNEKLKAGGIDFQFASISDVLHGAREVIGKSKLRGWPPAPKDTSDAATLQRWAEVANAALTYGQMSNARNTVTEGQAEPEDEEQAVAEDTFEDEPLPF